jgi:hypothetical protein
MSQENVEIVRAWFGALRPSGAEGRPGRFRRWRNADAQIGAA